MKASSWEWMMATAGAARDGIAEVCEAKGESAQVETPISMSAAKPSPVHRNRVVAGEETSCDEEA
jgi:hypothetical protein